MAFDARAFEKWKSRFKHNTRYVRTNPSDPRDLAKVPFKEWLDSLIKFEKEIFDLVQAKENHYARKHLRMEIAAIFNKIRAVKEPLQISSKHRSYGPKRPSKILIADLLQALEKSKGNVKSQSRLYEFLKSDGEYQFWSTGEFGEPTRLPLPNQIEGRRTQWANKLKERLLLLYFAIDDNVKRVPSTLSENQKTRAKQFLKLLGESPI